MTQSKVAEGPYTLTFTLPGLPKLPNRSMYANRWATAKEVKRWKQAVFTRAWPKKPPQPLHSAKLTLIRCSSVESDYDGLVGSFKACIDGLREAGVLVDDRKKNIGRPEYLWEYAAPKKGHIKIKVEEVV